MENSGKLFITAVNAVGIKGEDLFSKSDLYVIIKFGGKTVKTKTAKNQDFPVWNETFSFPYQNDNTNVEVTVMDDDLFKDDKVTVAHINSNQFPVFGEEKEYSIPLSFKNRDVGILHLRMKNDSKGNNYNNNKNINSVNDSSNIDMKDNNNNNNNNNLGGYNNTALGGHSYGNTNNNNNNNNHQGREFYRNVVETHYINGQFPEQNRNNINNNNNNNLNPNQLDTQYNNNTTLQTRDNNYPNLNSNQYNNNKQHEYDNSLHPHHNTTTTTAAAAAANTKPDSTILPTNYTTNSTHSTYPTTAATATTAATTAATMKNIKDKKKKIRHSVRLPEKHHHYQDGYTSSSSESSNEGEKRRLAQRNADIDATNNIATTNTDIDAATAIAASNAGVTYNP